jgi:multiple antibiotic resistance protein
MPGSLSAFFNQFVLTFVPIFVVIDALGTVPVLISITDGITQRERKRLINLAAFTAMLVGLVFLFVGKLILALMDISLGSFAIAGGLVLLILSIRYMTTGHMVDIIHSDLMGVVPIGTPLTVGPATITTLLLLNIQFPLPIVLLSFVLNMIAAWIIFRLGDALSKLLGRGGIIAFSRVFNMLLAAIGVNMMIQGLYLLNIISTKPTP